MTESEETVQRVTRAIAKSVSDKDHGVSAADIDRIAKLYEPEARAAIAAMPDPSVTVGMVTAALAAVGEHDVSLSSSSRMVVTKMIQAALAWRPAPPVTP